MNKKRTKKELQTEYEFVLGKLDAAFVTIAELKDSVTELEKEQRNNAEAPKPVFGRVKLEVGEKYYSITMNGGVQELFWCVDEYSYRRWNMGNVSLTREAAELAHDRRQAKVRIIDKLAELKTEELDWSDKNQTKCCLQLVSKDRIEIDETRCYQITEKELYSTRNACEWVAKNMSADVKLMLTGEVS